MKRYGMVIDLKKCVGCQTCTISCKLFHGLGPDLVRVKVLEQETGEYPQVERLYVPVRCMHCSHPECMKACPTGATKQRPDGVIIVDKGECMGCRYCAIVCPYQARAFRAVEKSYFPGQENPWEMSRFSEHEVGTMEKCDFCCARLDEGMKRGLQPGKDPEATPMCVISCIGKALYFGDLNDPESVVARLVRERRGFRLKEEVGTEPAIYFLPRR